MGYWWEMKESFLPNGDVNNLDPYFAPRVTSAQLAQLKAIMPTLPQGTPIFNVPVDVHSIEAVDWDAGHGVNFASLQQQGHPVYIAVNITGPGTFTALEHIPAYNDSQPGGGLFGSGILGDVVGVVFAPVTGGASLALASNPIEKGIGLAAIGIGAGIAGSVVAGPIGSKIASLAVAPAEKLTGIVPASSSPSGPGPTQPTGLYDLSRRTQPVSYIAAASPNAPSTSSPVVTPTASAGIGIAITLLALALKFRTIMRVL